MRINPKHPARFSVHSQPSPQKTLVLAPLPSWEAALLAQAASNRHSAVHEPAHFWTIRISLRRTCQYAIGSFLPSTPARNFQLTSLLSDIVDEKAATGDGAPRFTPYETRFLWRGYLQIRPVRFFVQPKCRPSGRTEKPRFTTQLLRRFLPE